MSGPNSGYTNRATSFLGEGPVADRLRNPPAGNGGGGGGGGGNVFPNRYDLSVNSARAEGAASSEASLITLTSGSVAGGYNGGGTGNKAILGCKGHDQLPLGQLLSVQFDYEIISLSVPPAGVYMNLVVDIGGGDYRLFVINPSASPFLNLGTLTPLGGNKFRFRHEPAVNFVSVVTGFVPPTVPVNTFGAPPVGTGTVPFAASSTANPPAPGTPNAGDSFNSLSYRYSDILAAHPTAKLVDVSSGDGGMPKLSVTPAVLVVFGDSATNVNGCVRVSNILVNDAAA